MVVARRGQVELGEDVAHVLLDGLVADHQLARDRRVGAPFGHQSEHLALASGQALQGVAMAAPGEELADHFRIEDRGALGDPTNVAEELADVSDPVLELRNVSIIGTYIELIRGACLRSSRL